MPSAFGLSAPGVMAIAAGALWLPTGALAQSPGGSAQVAEAAAPAASDVAQPARAVSQPDGASPQEIPSAVRKITVSVPAFDADSATLRVEWEPPLQDTISAYVVTVSRVHIPQAIQLLRLRTPETGTTFRIPTRPAELNCCPVMGGEAAYTDGPAAGDWGAEYPEGPYRQLLTVSVTPVSGAGAAGVIRSRQVDPLAVQRRQREERERVAAGEPPAPAAETAAEVEGQPPREPEPGAQEPGEAAEPADDGTTVWMIVLAAAGLLLLLLIFIRAPWRRRPREGDQP